MMLLKSGYTLKVVLFTFILNAFCFNSPIVIELVSSASYVLPGMSSNDLISSGQL